ncbi:formate dehydrogenase accessory sulfurtransferase FdhD [Roseococcus sp. DSY-14]|uniref:formate dehydrogenase accessory sulfurtransferase FdhD n=1 Tax=Roseococcus sp. DSY-14 TaxID=3369650 RepID=UPI00387AC944
MRFAPAIPVARLAVRGGGPAAGGERLAAEEVPVAIAYAGRVHAVLMATPADIEDLAVGFTLTEGIARTAADIGGVEVLSRRDGLVARVWLGQGRHGAPEARRRAMAGGSGCGLCGVASLAEAVRPPPRVPPGGRFRAADVAAAMAAMGARQELGAATRAAHAAALWRPGEGCVALREDVGRHNALDKLAGALARAGGAGGAGGLVALSSRVSVEMVQKAARIGAAGIVAVSAPTALAVRTAEAAGLTLVAVAREDGFEVFAGAGRLAHA